MYLLDTSALLELLWGSAKGRIIKEDIKGLPIFISSITLHEIYLGLKETEQQFLTQFIQDITILNFDKKCAKKSAMIEKELRQKGTLINRIDTLIAGTCLLYNLIICACDKDFTKIEGLKVKTY